MKIRIDIFKTIYYHTITEYAQLIILSVYRPFVSYVNVCSPHQMKGQAGQLKEKKVSGFISQVPNLLSLSRIIVGYVIGALLFSNYEKRMSAALMCYIVGSVTDYLDGKTARAFGVVSTFGALFDSLCDKIMVLSV